MQTIDPKTPEAFTDRAAFHNGLRDKCPVAHVPDDGFYHVAGYDNVKQVLEDHEYFSKAWSSQLAPMEHLVGMNQDPPQFGEFRRLYNAYMSPGGVKRWAADCERIANEVIDSFEARGSGDLQSLFGKPVPAKVTARALGFPEDAVDQYRRWTDAFITTMVTDPAAQQATIAELYAFFDVQFEQRRALLRDAGITEPDRSHVGTIIDDSLTSVLMTSRFQGRYLTDEELRRTVRGFFIGGVDTSGSLMLNTLYHLLQRPTLWEQVRADLSLIDAAIEESLRFDPPAIGMFRGTPCPVTMAGETIPEGARVLFSILSANRDPAHFADPDTFRLDRKGERHIAFGSGAHFCPGAWTARMESQIALRAIITRLPKLRLTGEVQFFDIINFIIVKAFPAARD